MNKIIPTVGRKVWYFPSTDQFDDDTTMIQHKRDGEVQPLDATVIAVYSDDVVNLSIFDIHGHIFSRRNVKLLQEGDRAPSMGRFAQWMPYQIGQAKKEDATTDLQEVMKAAKAKEYDFLMEMFDADNIPPGSLTYRVGYIIDSSVLMGRTKNEQPPVDNDHVADGCEKFSTTPTPEANDPNDPPRPMLHYGIKELRYAWDVPLSHARMGDGKVFNKTTIDAELSYRGDTYGSPRAVASQLIPNTKSA